MPSLAPFLDYANHKANATPDDIKQLCSDVKKYGFHAAFVNPCYVTLAKETGVRVGTVVSFPLGGDTKALKMAITNNAVSQGTDELDVVPNIGLYLSGDKNGFLGEMQAIVESAHMLSSPVIVKFILEPGLIPNLGEAAELVRAARADYIKIGSGMGPRNPTLEDLKAVKDAIGDSMKIKVAGGITDKKTAEVFLKAGAHHLGTSHAIQIVSESNSTPAPASTKSSE